MNQKLQQAIAAARAGQSKEAQLLLTQVLKEDPNEVQAWFLLSHLVDSPKKQVAYLSKVLALDPTHEKARQRLAHLQEEPTPIPHTVPDHHPTPVTSIQEEEDTESRKIAPQPEAIPVSTDPLDFVGQEEGDTLPPWLTDDTEHLMAQAVYRPKTEELEEDEEDGTADLPDWLQESVGQEWSREEEVTQTESGAKVAAAPKAKEKAVSKTAAAKPPANRQQEVFLQRVLIGLVTAAAIVLVLLIYLITTSF